MELFERIVLPLIIAAISSGTIGAISAAVAKRISKGDPKNVALRLLLQDKLTYLINKELECGYTTADKHKLIRAMYTAYENLDGNGDMTWLMSQYDKLNLKDGRRAA